MEKSERDWKRNIGIYVYNKIIKRKEEGGVMWVLVRLLVGLERERWSLRYSIALERPMFLSDKT